MANQPKIGGIDTCRLHGFVDRIERLEEERKFLVSDIKQVYQEAKEAGFNVKALQRTIEAKGAEPEQVELADKYLHALGRQTLK